MFEIIRYFLKLTRKFSGLKSLKFSIDFLKINLIHFVEKYLEISEFLKLRVFDFWNSENLFLHEFPWSQLYYIGDLNGLCPCPPQRCRYKHTLPPSIHLETKRLRPILHDVLVPPPPPPAGPAVQDRTTQNWQNHTEERRRHKFLTAPYSSAVMLLIGENVCPVEDIFITGDDEDERTAAALPSTFFPAFCLVFVVLDRGDNQKQAGAAADVFFSSRNVFKPCEVLYLPQHKRETDWRKRLRAW